jgi:hypothetical protein
MVREIHAIMAGKGVAAMITPGLRKCGSAPDLVKVPVAEGP